MQHHGQATSGSTSPGAVWLACLLYVSFRLHLQLCSPTCMHVYDAASAVAA